MQHFQQRYQLIIVVAVLVNFVNQFVGVASTNPNSVYHPTVKLSHSDNIDTLYYNLFGPTGIITADNTVVNRNEIKHIKSGYNGNYNVVGVGTTVFTVNLQFKPESLSYDKDDCEIIEYTTTAGIMNQFNCVVCIGL